MRRLAPHAVVLCGALISAGFAQTPKPFPEGVFAAKTVAIINDTKTPTVEKGADDALASWGQFKVVDDPQLADITIHFEKTRQHEGRDTQTPDPNGKDTSYSYSMSFSSSITMTVFYKDQDKPFYSTKTEDSKAKAGTTCINNLHTAYRTAAAQKSATQP